MDCRQRLALQTNTVNLSALTICIVRLLLQVTSSFTITARPQGAFSDRLLRHSRNRLTSLRLVVMTKSKTPLPVEKRPCVEAAPYASSGNKKPAPARAAAASKPPACKPSAPTASGTPNVTTRSAAAAQVATTSGANSAASSPPPLPSPIDPQAPARSFASVAAAASPAAPQNPVDQSASQEKASSTPGARNARLRSGRPRNGILANQRTVRRIGRTCRTLRLPSSTVMWHLST